MDLLTPIFRYFRQAIGIVNTNIAIFVVYAGLGLAAGILSLLRLPILTLTSLLLSFLSWAVFYSTPHLIYSQGKKISVSFILENSFKTAKRLIVPGIILFILFIGVFIAYLGWVASLSGGNEDQMVTILSNNFSLLKIIPSYYFFPVAVVASVFSFQPVFFSLEKKGFFASFPHSFFFSLKHLKFVLIWEVLTFLPFLVFGFIPNDIRFVEPGLAIERLISDYVSLIMLAGLTIYYKDHKDKLNSSSI